MRLTRYTDYALRILIHLAVRDDRMGSIGDIAKTYGISQNHLMKVASSLAKAGFVTAVRGRGGGLRLSRPASEINIGAVVRETEESFCVADCANCSIQPACGLTSLLGEAVTAFLDVLDRRSLADVVRNKAALAALLGNFEEPPPRA